MIGMQKALEKFRTTASLLRGRLRAKILALRGASVKPKSSFGARCKIERPWCVTVGSRFVAEDSVYLKIVDDNARLDFGDYVFIGRGTEFDVSERVSVGEHTVIAPGCFVTDHNHGVSPDLRIDEQPGVVKPVVIGKDVWLGAKVVVLAGVSIGDGAVVGANAVVTRDIPPAAIAAGAPARILRFRDSRVSVGGERF